MGVLEIAGVNVNTNNGITVGSHLMLTTVGKCGISFEDNFMKQDG